MENQLRVGLTDRVLAGKLEAAAKAQEGEFSMLLREAARRLKLRNSPAFRVASIRQVSIENPAQFEGLLEYGDTFFIRYVDGNLTVHVDDHLVEYIETEHFDPKRIGYDDVASLLANMFEFPVALTPVAKR